MSRKILVFILVMLLGLGGISFPAAAEDGQMTMKNLAVNVWPEYDSDQVEVGYYGTFVNDTGSTFQGEIRYNIPKGARINMVCETEKGMICQEYIVKNAGDYEQVVWRPSHPIEPGAEFPVMLEYYYNPVGTQPQRQFDFDFTANFNVENLTVAIKQPFRSTDFVIAPEAETRGQDGEGFNSYEYRYSTYNPGETLSYSVSYVKNDNEPSINSEEEQQSNTGGGTESTAPMNSSVAIIIVAFLIVLAVIIYVAMNNNNSKQRSTRKSSKKTKQQSTKKKNKPQGGEAKKKADKSLDERKKLRKMLLDGKISEETYRQLIAEIEEEEN